MVGPWGFCENFWKILNREELKSLCIKYPLFVYIIPPDLSTSILSFFTKEKIEKRYWLLLYQITLLKWNPEEEKKKGLETLLSFFWPGEDFKDNWSKMLA